MDLRRDDIRFAVEPVTTFGVSKVLVSVVMPAFNAEAFVAEAIRSVCAQTHSNLELIVVDDGSTDATAAAVRAVGDPRVILVQQENGGEPAARNTGLSHATGELVAFLDADDLWMPTKLEKQIARMLSDEKIVAVGTLAYYFGRTLKRLGTTGFVLDDGGSERILREGIMPFPISSLITTRTACEAVDGFSVEVPQAPDYGFVLALAQRGRVVTVPERLTGYRLHGSALSKRYQEVHRIARYSEYVASQRASGEPAIGYVDFSTRFTLSPQELRLVRGRAAFRDVGVAFFDGKPVLFAKSAVAAAWFAPRYSFERVWSRLRPHRPYDSSAQT